jgi:outer membrane protein assembly factor BamC
MRVLQKALSGAVLVSLASCSMFANKPVDYAASASSIPPLKVPPDLTRPAGDDNYQIPAGAFATSDAPADMGHVPTLVAAGSAHSSAPAASAAAATPATAVSTLEPAGTASLREMTGGNTIIVLNDPFDRSWRKVGLALEAAGLVVEDRNREKGIYYLRPVRLDRGWLDKMMFWKSDEDTSRHYRVHVKDGGNTCEVSIADQAGASTKVSKQMLEAIYKNINQQQ